MFRRSADNPPLNSMFDAGGRAIPAALELWPGLLGLALALNVAELILRKWRGLLDGLRLRRGGVADAAGTR